MARAAGTGFFAACEANEGMVRLHYPDLCCWVAEAVQLLGNQPPLFLLCLRLTV
jgi:hypothetical protein